MMLCCVIVSHAAVVDLTKMLRKDGSGKTRCALHAPNLSISRQVQRLLLLNYIFSKVNFCSLNISLLSGTSSPSIVLDRLQSFLHPVLMNWQ